jgi:peroxiredoxin
MSACAAQKPSTRGDGGAAVNTTTKRGTEAPEFELPDIISDEKVSLRSLRGKVVLVDFWASWCEPCKRELPQLAALAERLRGKGVEVLAVTIDKKRENAQALLKQLGIQLRVLWNADGSVADRYEPGKMPSNFVIDASGKVRYVNEGYEVGDEKRFEQQLLELAR